jgi:hypothetical protein
MNQVNKISLYKKGKVKDQVLIWSVWTGEEDGVATLYRESGTLKGKKTIKKKFFKKGNNIGKANEKTPAVLAQEAMDRYIKGNIEDNMVTDLKDIDLPPTFIKPALAKTFDPKKVKFPCYVQPKLNGCLSGLWELELEDGSKKTIQEIVDLKLDCKVKSYNVGTRKIEFEPILGHQKTKKTKKWYRIEFEDGTVSKPLTGNHKVWVENKQQWIRTDCLDDKDILTTI